MSAATGLELCRPWRWVSAVPPYMLQTEDNRGGVPIEVFDEIRAASIADRSQAYKDLADDPCFGNNRPEPTCRREPVSRSGGSDCSQVTATRSSASPRPRRPTSEATWRRSTSPVIHGDDDQV